MIDNPYQVLGLPEEASTEEIKKAYRQKAKENHPDLHPDDPDAIAKMNEINEAYDMLMNPKKYEKMRAKQKGDAPQSWYEPGSKNTIVDNIWELIMGWMGNSQNVSGAHPRREPNDRDEFAKAIAAFNDNRFTESLQCLKTVPVELRTPRWYYLSAIANCNLKNNAQALEHIKKAVAMEPRNQTYKDMRDKMDQIAFEYANNGRGKGSLSKTLPKVCFGLCAIDMLCLPCMRGGC